MDKFNQALDNFIVKAQALVDAHYVDMQYVKAPRLVVEGGPKYARVVKREVNTDGRLAKRGSVYCFIERETGTILKAASYKAPEKKNPRGNIYDDNPVAGVTWNGTVYLR